MKAFRITHGAGTYISCFSTIISPISRAMRREERDRFYPRASCISASQTHHSTSRQRIPSQTRVGPPRGAGTTCYCLWNRKHFQESSRATPVNKDIARRWGQQTSPTCYSTDVRIPTRSPRAIVDKTSPLRLYVYNIDNVRYSFEFARDHAMPSLRGVACQGSLTAVQGSFHQP